MEGNAPSLPPNLELLQPIDLIVNAVTTWLMKLFYSSKIAIYPKLLCYGIAELNRRDKH
jgi:hypothetical protein